MYLPWRNRSPLLCFHFKSCPIGLFWAGNAALALRLPSTKQQTSKQATKLPSICANLSREMMAKVGENGAFASAGDEAVKTEGKPVFGPLSKSVALVGTIFVNIWSRRLLSLVFFDH
jgi:hypothetical protein